MCVYVFLSVQLCGQICPQSGFYEFQGINGGRKIPGCFIAWLSGWNGKDKPVKLQDPPLVSDSVSTTSILLPLSPLSKSSKTQACHDGKEKRKIFKLFSTRLLDRKAFKECISDIKSSAFQRVDFRNDKNATCLPFLHRVSYATKCS